jgi:SulP family sulfate permease
MDWDGYVPIIPTIKNYQRADFSHDLIAGLVVGMVTIPQAVAYAFLAGVPPESGLYACLVPMLLYTVFGSSKQLVVGPVAVAALMVAATVAEYAPQYSDAYLALTTIICLQSGLFLWLLRLSRMGGLVNLLSHPVITGFVNAAAILIIVSQLPAFTGIEATNGHEPWQLLFGLLSKLGSLQPLTLTFGLGALLLLFAFPTLIVKGAGVFRYDLPKQHAATRLGPMVVAALAIVAVAGFNLQEQLSVVGSVPSGLPDLTIPSFDPELWLKLLPASIVIALVSYIESYSIGTTLAVRRQTRVNSHQELIALGAANVGAAFTGAYPVAGSFSRSSVNYAAGARTPVSSIVCALVIVFTLLFLTALFESLPNAVLAAIVMVSVVGLMDLKNGPRHWQLHREDTITEYATMVLVLLMGVEVGLIAGVFLSIAFFVRTSSRPHITQVGRLSDTEHFRSIKRYDVETLPNVLALRIDENIYFANATQIEDKCLKRSQRRPATEHLLIVCSSVNMIDATGIQMLHRLNTNLQRAGITMNFCDLKGTLLPRLQEAGLFDVMSGQNFISADRAMRHFERELADRGAAPDQ